MNKTKCIHRCIIVCMILVLSASAFAATINLQVEPTKSTIEPNGEVLLNVYVEPNGASIFAATVVFRMQGEFSFVDDFSLDNSGTIFTPLDTNQIIGGAWTMDGTTLDGDAVTISPSRRLLGQIKVRAPDSGNLQLEVDSISEFWESRTKKHTLGTSTVAPISVRAFCQNECETLGSVECVADATTESYRECKADVDADICFEWGLPTKCPIATPVCSEGSCITAPRCGDGTVSSGEQCDDGNIIQGDGCSKLCQIETGFECLTQGQACTLLCGNGDTDTGETCSSCPADVGVCLVGDDDEDDVDNTNDQCPGTPTGRSVYPEGSANAGCQLGDINKNGCIDLPDWNIFLGLIGADFENNGYIGPGDLTNANGLDLGDWNMFLGAMGQYFTTC